MITTYSLHDTDFYSWTQQQAALLRMGNLAELDVTNLIDEIEDMGRSERRAIKSRIEVLLMHLLKWQYQPAHRSTSWRATITGQRRKIKKLLQQNPSLKPELNTIVVDAYEDACFDAAGETGLDEHGFPVECPWTVAQSMDEQFWPGVPV
jgi:hypothetical protein